MKKIISIGMVVAALFVVPFAAGASSLLSAYGSQGSTPIVEVKSSTASQPTSPTAAQPSQPAESVSSSGPAQLPFTGLDLVVLVGLGAGLLGVGFGVRRLARDKE